VLGPRTPAGAELCVPVRAAFGFLDRGVFDPKLICSERPLTAAERRGIERFFWAYAHYKRLLLRLNGGRGRTKAVGWLVA
jgi:inorganic pyrophosphatase